MPLLLVNFFILLKIFLSLELIVFTLNNFLILINFLVFLSTTIILLNLLILATIKADNPIPPAPHINRLSFEFLHFISFKIIPPPVGKAHPRITPSKNLFY